MASNNNTFVLVMMLVVFAVVVEQCAGQENFTCATTGTPCIAGGIDRNMSNCCASSCTFLPPVGHVGTCDCSVGPCVSDADCCVADSPAVRVCWNNRCAICNREYEECTRDSDCCPDLKCFILPEPDFPETELPDLPEPDLPDWPVNDDLIDLGLTAECRKPRPII